MAEKSAGNAVIATPIVLLAQNLNQSAICLSHGLTSWAMMIAAGGML
jgi:hypothetical protein